MAPPPSPLAAAIARLPSQLLAGLDSRVPPPPLSPPQAMEGMETGGVVDVPDTPSRAIHSESNKSFVGRSICSDMILEVPDTPDRLASQQAGGSGAHVLNAGVSNRLRGGCNISSIVGKSRGPETNLADFDAVGKSRGLETNLVDFDLPPRGESFCGVDGMKKSDAARCGTLKLSKMNARKHEASVASSRDKFIEASSSHGSPCVSIISANCEIKKGNWKKASASSGEVSHVGTKGRNNKITHQRFAAESATSSRDNDPLVDSFDFRAQYEARNKHNGAPSFGTNKLASDRICPKVDVVIGAHSRSNDRGACGTRDGSSTSKHNVDLPRISLARDHGKEVHFDGNSQVGSVQNGSVPLESRKYGQRKLVRNGRISPNNIVNGLCSFELIGKINRDGDVGTTRVNDGRAKDKGKGVDGRTTAVNGGVVKDRHSSRRSPVPKLDELFRTAELMRGSGSTDSCLEHMPASSINIHCTSRGGISNGYHGMVEDEASRVEPSSQNTSHEPRKHHSQNGHPHNASSSSMAVEDFQMEGQNRSLCRMKRQCTSFSNNNRESSAFSSIHSFSAGMLSAPGCSGSSSNLGPIIEIDESCPSKAERCDRSNDNIDRNDDSQERARQIEADEELARQLQEELYNEDSEADTSMAFILQQEENSRAISTRNHDVSSPIGMSRAPFYRHRLPTQNNSRLANRVHGAASTRMAQMRRNLVVHPRRASYRRRSIEFPASMGMDMRLDILEAMEASTLPITNPLFHVQRDFNENDYEMLLALDDENHRSSGASVRRIHALPQSIVQSENCEEACAVCLENPSKGDTIRHLPCLHKFHKDCIDPWLARKPSCPVCKSGIT